MTSPGFVLNPILTEPTAYVVVPGAVQKIVHIRDLVKCNNGGTVNLVPTEERNTEIKDDLRVVTDVDLLTKVTISGCSRGCTKVASITTGLADNVELKAGAIPVVRTLVAVSDKGCTVTWIGYELDVDAAVNYADSHAFGFNQFQGWCGRYVQNALREGFHTPIDAVGQARNLGPSLQGLGFQSVSSGTVNATNSSASFPNPQKGDVAVFDQVAGHDAGHVAIWDGNHWVSDTVQPKFSANQRDYAGGHYTIYRYPGNQAHAKPK
jgi:hypothetical protein